MNTQKLDLTGQKYHKLTVLHRVPNKGRHTRWLCQCECGNTKEANTNHLRFDHVRSCGCIPRQNSERVLKEGKLVRPDGYHSWKAIQSRCYCESDENYRKYGAKGITVCDRWRGLGGLANFLADMGPKPSPRHSIDRIKSTDNYSPETCRWATPLEQGQNKRNANLLTHNGKTQTMAAWTRELGLATGNLRLRLNRGWTVHEALSTPRLGKVPPKPE